MNEMSSIEINIPEELSNVILQITNDKQLFIIEAIKERIKQVREGNLEKQLVEGYKYTAKNHSQLIKDFTFTDLENWDDEY